MGNAGDLIKHGLLAEFCEWRLQTRNGVFSFIDPFGGRPYVSPPHGEVVRRVQRLESCALTRAQPDIGHCYYGSGNVIKHSALAMQRQAVVKISDRDKTAFQELIQAGFEAFHHKAFQRQESFSIIDCRLAATSASLVLLDPYDDFLAEYASTIVPKLPEFILASSMPVALFVLCEDWGSALGLKWQKLKESYLTPELIYFSLACGKIPAGPVKGESRYHSEVILLLAPGNDEGCWQNLAYRLQTFSKLLGAVLGQRIRFQCSWG